MESLEIAMECIGSYQTLQEEGYTIGERKTPGAFSCIALYSIKRDAAVSRSEIKEMQRFTFYIQAGGGQGNFSGVKSVAFTDTEQGYHEYSGEMREDRMPQNQRQRPEWVRNPPQYADAIIEIGTGDNDWNSEVQKYMAQGNALVFLARQISEAISVVIRDYIRESGINSAALLSDLKKVREAQVDGTNYQMWQMHQEVVDKASKEAESRSLVQ